MRFERGGTLGAALKDKKTLPEEHLVNVLEACMDGLETVHKAGFIHRDIKPPNIYLRDDGRAVLIDFGSARQALSEHTQTLTTLVSPGYAPFEQYQSDGKQQGPWDRHLRTCRHRLSLCNWCRAIGRSRSRSRHSGEQG